MSEQLLTQSSNNPNNPSNSTSQYIPTHSISALEMYNCINNKSHFGIDGYNYPSKYNDPRAEKFKRENYELDLKVWAKKALYPEKNFSKDKDGNNIIPQKKNFIDDEIKKCNQFFDKEKAEKYAESKGLLPPMPKFVKKNFIYASDRETILAKLYREKKHDGVLNELQTERAEKVKEKNPQMWKTKPHWADILKNKKSVGSTGVRNGIVSEAEFVGEKLPFWNSYIKKDEETAKSEFLPKDAITRKRLPVYKYTKESVLGEEHSECKERKESFVTEKSDKIKEKWNDKKIIFSGSPLDNKNKIDERGKLYFVYKNVIFFNKN